MQNSFETRMKQSLDCFRKYPSRIPCIIENSERSTFSFQLKKYLVPDNITVGQFISMIRQRIKLASFEAIFLFVNNVIPRGSSYIKEVYDEHKDIDGFLYLIVQNESTFGT